jgi:hypothetical protein
MSSKRPAVRFVSKADAENIGKVMRLAPEQVQALQATIDVINTFSEMLDERARMVPSGSLQAKKLDKIERAFHRLNEAIDNAGSALKYALPPAVGDYLSRSLTFTAIVEATGKKRFPRYLKRKLNAPPALGTEMTVDALEHHLHQELRTSCAKYGDLMFKYVIGHLHALIVEGRKVQRGNKGGRNPVWQRNLVLDLLIEAAPEIVGTKPTANSSSRFVELCQAVLAGYELPTDGLEKHTRLGIKEFKAQRAQESVR